MSLERDLQCIHTATQFNMNNGELLSLSHKRVQLANITFKQLQSASYCVPAEKERGKKDGADAEPNCQTPRKKVGDKNFKISIPKGKNPLEIEKLEIALGLTG